MTREQQDISDIISGCIKDNRKAQELLYRKFYRAMMTICLRYTKNESDALEVMNTGFHKVFRNISKYNASQASIYTWIRIIIVNTCIDFVNARAGSPKVGEMNEVIDVDIPPSIISKMSVNEILELVRQLPPATRAVFNLYVMEGYNHKDIATLMEISQGTSKWHLSEARKKLQKMINAWQVR